MRKSPRNVLVLLIAIAQLIVGGLLLGSGVLSLIGSDSNSAATVTINTGGKKTTMVYDTREEMEREAPGYKSFMLGSSIAGMLLASVMMAGALGLLVRKMWGWWLSLLWAFAGFAYQAGIAVYLWTVAIPAANRIVKVVPRDDAGVCGTLVNTNTFFHVGWAIFASGFWLYPLLILLFLVLPPVRRSLRPVDKAPPDEDEVEEDRPRRHRRDEEEDEDDEEDRRPHRRNRDDDD